MKEIEVKILEVDRKKVEKKLVALGAKKIFEGELDALFFDFKNASLRKEKKTLRLRTDSNKTVLTFKNPAQLHRAAKIKEEREVEVSDGKNMRLILESLGLSVWLQMRKRRVSYQLPDATIEFDTYHKPHDFIPEFLEIEAADEAQIYHYAQLLGFTKEQCLSWSAAELEKHYKK